MNGDEKNQLQHLGISVSLQYYLERLFEERDRQYKIMFEAAQEALRLARAQIDHRLEGMNQFQHRMDRLEATFSTKDDVNRVAVEQTEKASLLAKSIDEKIESVKNFITSDFNPTEYVRQETYNIKTENYDKWVKTMTSEHAILMEKYGSRLTIPTVVSVVSLLVSLASVIGFFLIHLGNG